MPTRPCSAPSLAPVSQTGSPPFVEPAAEVRQLPRVYWRVVAFAGIVMSFLVTGLILVVSARIRSAHAAQDRQALGDETESTTRVKLPDLPANPEPNTDTTAQDRSTFLANVACKPEQAIATNLAVADIAPNRSSRRSVPEKYGTAIEFLSRPTEAARQALHEEKLLFVLHVSGNLEDAKFT